MAKANLTLPNGTEVTIEGDPEEIRRLLEVYAHAPGTKTRGSPPVRESAAEKSEPAPEDVDLISLVVNAIKSSEHAELIEQKILDQRNQLNRVLLPLFIVHEELGNKYELTSGDIAKITRELGVPVGQPDVSKTLAGEASRFVLGDKTRSRGKAVRYKMMRRGVQYLAGVLEIGE
jgi:hypothetical protein